MRIATFFECNQFSQFYRGRFETCICPCLRMLVTCVTPPCIKIVGGFWQFCFQDFFHFIKSEMLNLFLAAKQILFERLIPIPVRRSDTICLPFLSWSSFSYYSNQDSILRLNLLQSETCFLLTPIFSSLSVVS